MCFYLHEFQLHELIHRRNSRANGDPTVVLRYLRSSTFEPLSSVSLRSLTKKALFLIALATAKRVSELQVLSKHVSFSSAGECMAYVPEFVTKIESAVNPLPCSFMVKSLTDFAAGLVQDLLLCPVRALREYLHCTTSFLNRPHHLFASPRAPSRAMSKNGISFLLREVMESGTSSEDGAPVKAHSVRGIATSSAFFKNWSVASVLDAAS